MAEAPLSSLCSICFTNEPKYRCPRCTSVRTCSLPCYKTHQARASCNGIRDPTVYVKKSQLATAAGVDHDYNFLSKIERAINRPTTLNSNPEQSSRHGEKQTMHIPGRSNAEKKRWNTDGTLVRYLHDNRIRVDRAPTGLSRQRANMTRYLQKSKRIVWTVEWIESNGDKVVSEVFEGATIEEAWKDVLKERGKKRKREEEKAEFTPNTRAQPAPRPTTLADSTAILLPAEIATAAPSDNQELIEAPAIEDDEQKEEPVIRQYFYLHKPHTPSNIKVLIPLDALSSLTSSLRDRVLLEIPTIYHLPHSAESLPSNYMTEQAYLSRSNGSAPRVGDFTVDAAGARKEKLQGGIFASRPESGLEDEEDHELDEKSILDMLRRDAGS